MSTKDRRYHKTDRAIKLALVELVKQKPFDQLNVSMLMEKADLNRSTFYLHYDDLSDVLYALEKDILDGLLQVVKTKSRSSVADMLLGVALFAESNKDAILCLFSSNPSHFYRKIDLLVTPIINSSPFSLKGGNDSVGPYISRFFIAGGVGVLKQWLEDENRQSPQELIQSFLAYFSRSAGALPSR